MSQAALQVLMSSTWTVWAVSGGFCLLHADVAGTVKRPAIQERSGEGTACFWQVHVSASWDALQPLLC